MSDETILFLDLETTGLDLDTTHIVEFAALEFAWPLGDEISDVVLRLVNPGIPIPPEASAIHHLVDAHVANAVMEEELGERLAKRPAPGALCGHNISGYDLPLARLRLDWPPEAPVLDTDRLARHTWPDLPSYKMEALAYRFNLHPTVELASLVARPQTCAGLGAHSAGYDCLLCVALLRCILDETGPMELQDLAALSTSPITVKKMRFGKHFGQLVTDLPSSYVAWLMRQSWLETDHPDLHHTLKQLGR